MELCAAIHGDEKQQSYRTTVLICFTCINPWSLISCNYAENKSFFITTDRKILKKKIDHMTVINPLVFVEEYLE
jgi:hypothetical protein